MAVKIAVYIGRFQPFHNGHAHVIQQALAQNDYAIVLVGSAYQAPTIKNPFSYMDRVDMIHAWEVATFPGQVGRIFYRPVVDHPYNNAKWFDNVQTTVQQVIEKEFDKETNGPFQITLYGSQRDESTWYLESFPQWGKAFVQQFPLDSNLSATSLRDLLFTVDIDKIRPNVPPTTEHIIASWMLTGKPEEETFSPQFLRLREEYEHIKKYKKQWEAAPYAPTFVTTDAVVVQSGHVLVVERGNLPGKGLWALPGGFLNQNERMLDGAIRELLEETGIRLADGKRGKEITEDILRNAVKGEKVFDHPDRSLRGRTITNAFFFRLDDTKSLPKVKGQNVPDYESGGKTIVETLSARWIPISEARYHTDKWFEDHHAIVDTMLGLIKD